MAQHYPASVSIQLLSDLHLERPANAAWLQAHPLPAVAPVLVLAGDVAPLGSLHSEPVVRLLDWCEAHFEHTWWVPGNHEYYGPGAPDVMATLPTWHMDVRPSVHLCNGVEVPLGGDAALFLTTMWTPVSPENQSTVDAHLTQGAPVTCGGRPMRAADYARLHAACFGWLQQALAASAARHKVVVTHHCPVLAEDPAYGGNGLTEVFVTDHAQFISTCGAEHWAFGHTHYNAASGQQLGPCTLHSNQLGWVSGEGQPIAGFDPGHSIKL